MRVLNPLLSPRYQNLDRGSMSCLAALLLLHHNPFCELKKGPVMAPLSPARFVFSRCYLATGLKGRWNLPRGGGGSGSLNWSAWMEVKMGILYYVSQGPTRSWAGWGGGTA